MKETLESAVGDAGENVPEQLESAAGEVKEGASELAEELLESAEGDVKEEVSELAEEFSEAVDEAEEKAPEPEKAGGISVEFGEEYSDRDHVALYLHLYEELPPNYITKDEARDLGWDSGKGNLWDVAPGKSIGGDRFGNREGLLPGKKGRTYYECDIDYEGGYRGGKRIVYSSDGLVYYSEDHYENFELLYDEEGPAE